MLQGPWFLCLEGTMLGALKAQAVVFLGLLVHGLPDVPAMQQLITHLQEYVEEAFVAVGKAEQRIRELEAVIADHDRRIALDKHGTHNAILKLEEAQQRAQSAHRVLAAMRACEADWEALSKAMFERCSRAKWHEMKEETRRTWVNAVEDLVRAYHAGVK